MQNLSRQGTISIAVIWTFSGMSLASMIVFSIWTIHNKKFKSSCFYKSDLMIILAFLIGMLISGQATWAIIREGSRRYQKEFSPHAPDAIAKSLLVNEALWTVVNGLVRLNGLLMIMRVLCSPAIVQDVPVKKPLLYGLLIIIVSHTLGSMLKVLLICRPLSAQWQDDSTSLCGNQQVSFIVIEITGLLLDVVLLLLPLPTILSLHVSTEKKIAIAIIFEIGAVIIVISALRLKALYLAISPDFIFAQSYLGLLSAVGAMLGVTLCTTVFLVDIARKLKRAFEAAA